MKKIFNILLSAAALFAFAPVVLAQGDYSIAKQIPGLEWPKDNGVHQASDFAYSKNISSPQSDGTYWIKLESFSTGYASTIESAAPADIVLVLDLSSSMVNNNVYKYVDNGPYTPSRGYWVYSDNFNDYYIEYEGELYPVSHYRSTGNPRYYALTFTANGHQYFAYYDQIYASWEEVPKTGDNDRQDDNIWNGPLMGRTRVANGTRLDALKRATCAFIDEIEKNDKYEDDGVTEREGGRLGNRISIITFWSQANLRVSLQKGQLADESDDYHSTAEELKELVNGFTNGSGTRPDLGINEANNQFDLYVNEARKLVASRTVVVFTDGEPYPNTNNANYTSAIAAASTSKKTHEATVFTVGLFTNEPATTSNLYKFMNLMSSNAPNATSFNDNDYNFSLGFYKDASSANADLEDVFTEIAHQSGGSSTSLSASSSNVDVVSHSFILPQGADAEHIGDYVKIFVAKLEKIDENGEYVFYEEILKGHTPNEPVNDREGYYFYPLDENGEINGELTKVDAGISVTLDDTDDHKIAVTGFDYSSMYCGPVYALDGSVDHYQGYKIIIMIPIKMNPDAVGGPDVETNGAGSGIYVKADDAAAFVPYVSPTVSLPVNIHITKSGLKPGESAKFMIERADLPQEGPVNYNSLTWRYVSTVFVTRPQNAKDTDPDPVVYVRGLPANEDVTTTTGEGDDAVTTTEHRSFVYRISEENWSWSYDRNTLPQYTDTDYIDNPFRFSNTPKDNIDVKVRHAESKATNIFKRGVVTGNVKYDDSKKNTGTGRTQ